MASQDSELLREFEPENLSQKIHLRFERVNEVTFKLTDGEVTNVPAAHGKWGGYRTTKAVAWLINIAPGQWLARRRDEASGPSSFNEAKAKALAMARGACGDYFIENPIDHLNGLHARLLDRDGEAAMQERKQRPRDLVGAQSRSDSMQIDGKLRDAILDAEFIVMPSRAEPLSGEGIRIEFDQGGNPKLPECLRRRATCAP